MSDHEDIRVRPHSSGDRMEHFLVVQDIDVVIDYDDVLKKWIRSERRHGGILRLAFDESSRWTQANENGTCPRQTCTARTLGDAQSSSTHLH